MDQRVKHDVLETGVVSNLNVQDTTIGPPLPAATLSPPDRIGLRVKAPLMEVAFEAVGTTVSMKSIELIKKALFVAAICYLVSASM